RVIEGTNVPAHELVPTPGGRGMGAARPLSRTSRSSHEGAQRPSDPVATMWGRRPLVDPDALHWPPVRTLKWIWSWKQHCISFRNGALLGSWPTTVHEAEPALRGPGVPEAYPKRPM